MDEQDMADAERGGRGRAVREVQEHGPAVEAGRAARDASLPFGGLRELSLFTGAGGGLLGSMLLGFRTVAAVEYEPYCQRVLCARGGYVADAAVADGLGNGTESRGADLSGVGGRTSFPIHGDIRTFDARQYRGRVDIVTGGFPCQPFSQAGKRLGEDDPRNMWPHTVRVLVESEAPLGFFENVPGLLSSGYFGTVLGDLAEAGFDAEWCVLGADDVGAPHRRKRLWILAYRPGFRLERAEPYESRLRQRSHAGGGCSPWAIDPANVGHARCCCDEPHGGPGEASSAPRPTEGEGHQRQWSRDAAGRAGEADTDPDGEPAQWLAESWCERGDWLAQPHVGRVAHGVASRVDRLRALGNGQVPQAMAAAFALLARRAGI